ncbi:UDP-2-acetamido-2-deoxy-3-oxo-D-glucuronate aminotransferase [Variibacter gotjawalensis]|uniref:UDP-2-acetamido-2-deoxy-3-oxo-D-glucuronate aminotransferase n=1 Tax=Variibacter gotjawalensis TaxID=1333996 RepID=A0A0S3PTH8_9BRAD|nr:DegT/DnrJ/EryC1/StrS family aminotransferase [Variibacter gotjawalensis]NIK49570.1 dTDP-4-amino-4,6-dideoxygalactose transaminase [Variibacter gotjawalensis]RZS45581.1 dTDP-4-amino-4,6-dideoxygalactose transaminase [Variibacter gotjawalensis]BAT59254.1 UDP-2-acetamido-2-deoxy-3-oxo-D-glucuronate aminotransferase [Variibacter gotjawalensis]
MNKHAPIPVPFIDLKAQQQLLQPQVSQAIERVLAHGQYILGPEVRTLESDLSEFCGAKHVVSCSNGTDALALILMAKELKAGQAVLCPAFTFAATAEVIAWFGATAVFVDVHADTFNMDVRSLEAGIATAKKHGLDPVGVIPVDLFGQPVDYDAIEPVCEAHGLWMLCDAAQSFGGSYRDRSIGNIGMATATSFFPAKPLGCYGDGGAIFTNDTELDTILRSLRVHGEGVDRYDNVRIGMTGRLDTIQAAVLIEKLKIFRDEIAKRNEIAARYNAALSDIVTVPHVIDGATSVWAQYTIRVKPEQRDALAETLKAVGIPTAIYYRKPMHHQEAYKNNLVAGNGAPICEALAHEVISLPMHPYLEVPTQDRIVDAVRAALR